MKLTRIFDTRFDLTITFAREAHGDQVDKGGHPYMGHLLRVHSYAMEIIDSLPEGMISSDEALAIGKAALLHDTLEDTDLTEDDLRAALYSDAVVRRVERLTGKHGMAYLDNIRAMAAEGDIGVIIVKLADNMDNSDPMRINNLPEEQRGIATRYERSKAILREALDRKVKDFFANA